jgi:hypothetical protein
MDVHLVRAERRRIAEQFRSTLTCLGILRGQLIGALTDEARQHLRSVMDGESAVACELGEELLKLDASILDLQTKDTAQRLNPLLSVQLDF